MLTKEMEIFMEENQAEVKALLWKLCEIPSPSHHEERRAAFIKEWLEMQGAEGVFIDEAKNVIYPYHYEEGVPTSFYGTYRYGIPGYGIHGRPGRRRENVFAWCRR